jgi:hypothetical protein
MTVLSLNPRTGSFKSFWLSAQNAFERGLTNVGQSHKIVSYETQEEDSEISKNTS